MNYNAILTEYIDKCPYDEPIFIEDIKKYFEDIVGDKIDQVIKTIYVYVNRLVKKHILVQYLKGIYYKPTIDIFGEKEIDKETIINKKYMEDNNGCKGFTYGATLFNQLGLTTQVPRYYYIVTNECPNNNKYNNHSLGVVIKKPKIKINNNNYKYLQLLDLLNNKEKIYIEVDVNKEKEIIYKFIKDNGLEMEEIFRYAKEIKDKKAINKLFELE